MLKKWLNNDWRKIQPPPPPARQKPHEQHHEFRPVSLDRAEAGKMRYFRRQQTGSYICFGLPENLCVLHHYKRHDRKNTQKKALNHLQVDRNHNFWLHIDWTNSSRTQAYINRFKHVFHINDDHTLVQFHHHRKHWTFSANTKPVNAVYRNGRCLVCQTYEIHYTLQAKCASI
jgi:hypothetical protein